MSVSSLSIKRTQVRQAGTWDPLLQCLHRGNKTQRNYKGLKITACIYSWGKLWTRYKKTKNPTATSEELGAKAGYCTCPLYTAPPKGWAKHLSHSSGPTPGPAPVLTPCKEPACPHRPVSKGTCYLFSLPPASAGAPVKPCLNFLPGLLPISIDYGGQEPWSVT